MEGNFIEQFHSKVSSHPKVGGQGAINLKHDAFNLVVKHVLVEKGLISAEHFDDLWKKQLDTFVEMIEKGFFQEVSSERDSEVI